MIFAELREYWEQRRKAKDVLSELCIPQAVHYLAADRINRPGKRRAARWAGTHKNKKALT